MMQRVRLAGLFAFVGVAVGSGLAHPVQAQDREGAAMAAYQPPAPQPQPQPGPPPAPPPAGGPIPPPRGEGGGGGVIPPAVGNIGIGAIPVVPPPPIGYYAPARAVDYNLGKFFYYPYYYFPHSYWPTQTCAWPERPGQPYMRPPAYMAYPPFTEPHWRYEWYTPQRYYRGFHFWLDQF